MKGHLNCTSLTGFKQRSTLAATLVAALSLSLSTFAIAAITTPEVAKPATPTDVSDAINAKATEKCRSDLRVLDSQMQKDGYWMRGAGYGYGYGYPMGGYNYDESQPAAMGADHSLAATNYWRARPGYEVRTLLASAHILAQLGQQQACETVLGATRASYASYAADLRNGHVPRADGSRWRSQQLAAAQPISSNTSYRSDQLIGLGVLNPAGDELGSVDDLVMDQRTGRIAYLVIGRGGFLGIGEKYVPVPWSGFKTTSGTNLLVLDTTKDAMNKAPRVKENHFSANDDFAQESQKVDAYWNGQLAK